MFLARAIGCLGAGAGVVPADGPTGRRADGRAGRGRVTQGLVEFVLSARGRAHVRAGAQERLGGRQADAA
jgi:hypothetical protein